MGKSTEYEIKKVEKRKIIPAIASLSVLICLEGAMMGVILGQNSILIKEHKETLISIESSTNYSEDEVYGIFNTAVYSNPNLNDKEKDSIEKYLYVFAENKDYIDIDYIKSCLRTLKIEYINQTVKMDEVIVQASYNDKNNIITFYNSNNIEDVDSSTFTHELFHLMQKKYYCDYNDYLIESINTIYNEEYTNTKESSTYINYYNFTKMLIEIIGDEPIKRYQGYTDVTPILKSLTDLIDDKRYAVELLKYLDNYKVLFEKIKYDDSELDNANINELDNLKRIIVDRIGNYYEAKYGFSMDNDLVMLYYYDFDKFCDEFKKNMFEDEDVEICDVRNSIIYFNNNQMNDEISVNVKRTMNVKSVILDSEGRVVNSDENVEDIYYIYIINNENRYINKDLCKKKIY